MNKKNADLPLRVRDVFVPGGFPQYTYQSREKYNVEGNLKSALQRLNKFIAVAGPTKSGKTVLVRQIVPTHESVWIEGGHITAIQDVWAMILADLDIPLTVVESQLQQSENVDALDTEAAFKPGGIGGSIKSQALEKSLQSTGATATYGNSAQASVMRHDLRKWRHCHEAG